VLLVLLPILQTLLQPLLMQQLLSAQQLASKVAVASPVLFVVSSKLSTPSCA
jgi:hypothetical protein